MGTGKVFWSCRSLISRLFKEPASCNCIYLCILTAHLAVKKVLYVIILVFTFGKKKKLNSLTNLESFQLHVYTRTYALDQMVQAATSSAGLRTIKRVEQTLQDLGAILLYDSVSKASEYFQVIWFVISSSSTQRTHPPILLTPPSTYVTRPSLMFFY
ncbi:hypothetical protein RHMOL_Rhmol13G0005000 [Rhododendron molle]|uniref:Uncharacterized protein n=1 Tax=Rhododendron molle TaxID=49168 RepID=A0ACC0L1H7_RHOML|nr:hypothetical protein RHMOL_Rhmol13G0005000 [Rhododendron molle]